MKEKDVKIGMKVVPHSKMICHDIYDSTVYKMAKSINQNYLYVIKSEDNYFILNHDYSNYGGDFYLASDFEPYIIVERRKKLIKLNSICLKQETK